MKKNFIKFNKMIFTALSLMLIVFCLVGCEGQDMESLLEHEAIQNEKYADMVKQIQGGNKTKVEENIIGDKGTNKEKEDSAFEDIGLVKKDRADGNGKVWTEIQGDKEKEYTDEYNLNKQEKALLEQKKKEALPDELKSFIDKINGMNKEKMFNELGYDETRNTKLADAGYYWYYSMNDNIVKVMNYDEVVNIIQKNVDANEGNMGLNNVTKEIYDKLKNRKLENQHKQEVKQVDSLIVHLTNPKTVDQLGGNKVGDNKGLYKGQIQQPRKYGNSAYSGSMLVACNSMLGSNYERYYECRNGFIVLKAEGYSLYNSLSGTDRNLFTKTEWECFKLNNPNIKIVGQNSSEYYNYNQTFDYGTWQEYGEPMWTEGVNQCVVNFLGQSLFQTGKVINGTLTAVRPYSPSSNNPQVYNADGVTPNQEFTNEMNDFWHNSSIDHSQEAQNNIVRKYMH